MNSQHSKETLLHTGNLVGQPQGAAIRRNRLTTLLRSQVLFALFVAATVGSVAGRSDAATRVTFYNRTGSTLYIFYEILEPGGTTYCSDRQYGGTISPSGQESFSVATGNVGFFNFRTCSSPCNDQCVIDYSSPYEDIDVWIDGVIDNSFGYNLY